MTRIRLAGDHSAYHAGSAAVWQRLRQIAGAALVAEDAEYDLLLMNGEGSMHHGSPTFHRKMEQLRDALAAGKRAWLVNTVWQDNPHDYDDVLQRLEGVVVREPLSRAALKAHGVRAQIALDLSFAAPQGRPEPAPLDFGGGLAVTDFFVPAFDTFMRATGGRLSRHAGLDLTGGNWGWAIASLRSARLLVTGRHHAVYAACRARIPFAALSGNTHKIEGLIRASGLKIPIGRDPSQLPALIRFAERNPDIYQALFDWMECQPAWHLPGRPPASEDPDAPGRAAIEATREARRAAREHAADQILQEAARRRAAPPPAAERFLLEQLHAPEDAAHAARMLIAGAQDRMVDDAALDALRDLATCSTGREAALMQARLAVAHLTRREPSQARSLARAAIDALQDDPLREAATAALAGCFDWHGRWADAETLLLRGRPGSAMFEALHALVKLRMVSHFDDATRALLGFLASAPHPRRHEAIALRLDYLWRLDGPSDELLAESGSWEAAAGPAQAGLRAARIAMADQLGRSDVAERLMQEMPAAALHARTRPPLARMLADNRALREAVAAELDPAVVAAMAALDTAIRQGTEALRARIADRARRIAVVGNAASERGRGQGPRIDAHEMVLRFNRATLEDETAADYGRRTTHQLVPVRQSPDEYAILLGVEGVLFGVPDVLHRTTDWRAIAARHAAGLTLAAIPGEVWRSLAARLGAPPSNGLSVLSWLRGLRGTLPRDSVFGFAFTDQLGPGAPSSHYFEQARPSMHHNWPKERLLFDAMLAPQSDPGAAPTA